MQGTTSSIALSKRKRCGALSQATGRYLLLNVPVGTHTVTAQRIGYKTVTAQITVAAGATVWGYAVLGQANDLLTAGAERVFTDMVALHQLTFT